MKMYGSLSATGFLCPPVGQSEWSRRCSQDSFLSFSQTSFSHKMHFIKSGKKLNNTGKKCSICSASRSAKARRCFVCATASPWQKRDLDTGDVTDSVNKEEENTILLSRENIRGNINLKKDISGRAEQDSIPGPPVVQPEDFTLPQGQLSGINRTAAQSPADIFRCAGCTDAECQGAFGCAGIPWRLQSGGYLREILTARVYDVACETPLEKAENLSRMLGNDLFLKREDLQPVKSFKIRGAYNRMAQLSPEQLQRGVICSSAGNHAQGVALGAKKLGCSAIICMPTNTPKIKVDAVRALGGTVDLAGDSYQETQAYAQKRAAEEERVFIAPYDDPYTIAGQGTIAAEILRQCDMDQLDAVFVAVGGGGLIAGMAAYIKALRPSIKVIGVEPVGANAMAQSLALGQRVVLSRVDAFADGVAVKQVGAETFRLSKELLDGVVLVDNTSISAAIKDVFNETRSILEPSGAVAVAGAKAYLKHYRLSGQRIVAVTSGANMNFERLRVVADLADAAEDEAMLAVTLPEKAGAFLSTIEIVLNAENIDITEVKYRFSAGRDAAVLLGVSLAPGSKACADLVRRLTENGYPALDISGLELAQVHLRHLVGGHGATFSDRSSSKCEMLSNERIFRVQFPEYPGALFEFLSAISPRWSVSLFHYRQTGNRSSGVLVGLSVPNDEEPEFMHVLRELEGKNNDGFSFHEISGKERDVFKMFMQ